MSTERPLPGIYGRVTLPITAPPALETSLRDGTAACWGEGSVLATTHEESHAASADGVSVVCSGALPGVERPGEWVLSRYRTEGERWLEEVRGTLSLALVDTNRRCLYLLLDRMGTGSVVHAQAADAIRFAPSASPVAARGNHPLDLQCLYDYFYFQMVPSPGTPYTGLTKLGPAEVVRTGSAGETETWRYWAPSFERRHPPSHEDLVETLRHAVQASMGDGPVAAFLSGGLDSSSVVGLAATDRPDRVTAFTIGFDEPGYDEVPFARATAEHFGVRLIEKYVTPADVIETLDHVARYFDEPFGNSSAIPTFHCSALAVEHGFSRILAGDGGDELFAGNARYRMQRIFSHYERLPGGLRRGLIEPMLFRWLGNVNVFPLPKARGYVRQATTPLPERTQSYNFLQRTEPLHLFCPEFLAAIDREAPLNHLRGVYRCPEGGDVLDRLLFMDWKLTLADNDLRKVTGMCSSAGLEVSYPMLADEVVGLSLRIPSSQKLTSFNLRRFYRRAFRDVLPPSTLRKSKHGFGIPMGRWLAGSQELYDRAVANLEAFEGRGILQPAYVQELVSSIRGPHASYYAEMIWLIVVLEEWLAARPAYAGFRI